MIRLGGRTLLATGVLLEAFAALPSAAQSPYQVTDLGGPPRFDYSLLYGPSSEHVSTAELLFFFQNDGVHGRELWRTDGTALGTFMIRDICPGSCGSRNSGFGSMAPLGDRLLFAANDGIHGVELWVTDGTALGTTLVADIWPGYPSSYIRSMAAVAGQVFFVAQRGDNLYALWRSDGTPKGTYSVTPPGSGTTFAPSSIHVGPGFLYLCNGNWGGQRGLWRTDGTTAGTSLVAPLECSQTSLGKRASQTVSADGVLYFQGAPLDSYEAELWRSDGTVEGTYLVKDLDPNSTYGTFPYSFAWRESELIFVAGSTLWRSDGTEAGTVPISLSGGAQVQVQMTSWAVAGGRYFFAASDPDFGFEPWVYDGAKARRIADLAPGSASSLQPGENFSTFPIFEPFEDDLLFAANDGTWGFEIWRSNGTAEGTVRISDLAPGAEGIYIPTFWPNFPSSLGGRLTFPAHRIFGGEGLWRINAGGTSVDPIRILNDQTSLFEPTGSDRLSLLEAGRGRLCFEAVGDRLFFDRWRSDGITFSEVDLLRADGAEASTEEVLHGYPANPGECAVQGGRLIYARAGTEPESWEYVAVEAYNNLIHILTTSPNYLAAIPAFLTFAGSQAFLLGPELFLSDATPEGTSALANLDPDNSGGRIDTFSGEVVVLSSSLWITDPSEPSGARALIQSSYPEFETGFDLAPLMDRLLFTARDADHGTELWNSDGTAEGTALLVDGNPGPASLLRGISADAFFEFREPRLVSAGSFAVFAGFDSSHGEELWITDGTALGTHLLIDIYPGDYPSTPRNFTRVGDRVYFTAESEAAGLELWMTDGTPAGTVPLKDIAPGGASSIPDDLVVRDGVLYFSAWSPSFGREAWKSDGTPEGTVRITDIAPGPRSSSPQRFARAGNRLFFSATDQIHGYELWAISDDGSIPLFLDGFENESTRRWSESVP